MKIGLTMRYFLISLGVFLAILIFGSMFFQPSFSKKIEIWEGPLIKNSELMLVPGEVYVYTYSANNTKNNLTFIIRNGNGCTFIQVKESVNATGSCINKYGNDRSGNNVSLDPPYIIIFKPWMLAVSSDWQWNAKMLVNVGDNELILNNASFSANGDYPVFGRQSYAVQILTNSEKVTVWVDKEKRVLLREKGGDYEIDLVSAPFELNNSN